jgi:hypothetical protein
MAKLHVWCSILWLYAASHPAVARDRESDWRDLPAEATRDQVIARFGYPAEIQLVHRQGPFPEASEDWTYYTTHSRLGLRARTFTFSRGRVYLASVFEPDEVILRPDTPETIERILRYKAKQQRSER